MCGRYTFTSVSHIQNRYQTTNQLPKKFAPNYNATPGSMMPVITKNSPKKVSLMKWGLIPFWSKDPKIGYKLINARAETLHQKPAFKRALAKSRCLIPANGFYEWQKTDTTSSPHYFYSKKMDVISLAGIYETWKDAEDVILHTFAIVTTQANKYVKKIHHRMPLIFNHDQEDVWINPKTSTKNLLSLLSQACQFKLQSHKVSKEVNNPRHNSQDLIKKSSHT